jgi:uncharacterized protein
MLPKQINPIQLADHQKTLKGEINLSDMARLMELVCGKPGAARIDLCFGRDALGYLYMRGSIKAEFKVICQRCNSPMPLNLNIVIDVSPVRTDKEALALPKHYDPLLLTDDTLSLITIIEEEILLSIPMVPKHSPEECKVKLALPSAFEKDKDESNPFNALKKLLRE